MQYEVDFAVVIIAIYAIFFFPKQTKAGCWYGVHITSSQTYTSYYSTPTQYNMFPTHPIIFLYQQNLKYLRKYIKFYRKKPLARFYYSFPTLFVYVEQCCQFKLQSHSIILLLTGYILTFILLF